MRNIINKAEVTEHTIKLQQLGAKVTVINSTLCYVNFNLSGLILQYVYNVNFNGNYFLERIRPYPLAIQEISSERDVVKIIDMDIHKFKNAMKSSHIDMFIAMAKQINSTFTTFEDTFLNYNIPGEKVEKIYKKIMALELEIEMIREKAKSVEAIEKSELNDKNS
ncbi:MAG: hypothetical protein JXQ23_02915 [Clostridia bacterium]|nr:hypothetical protein [Clostridia bacterium]